MGVTLMYYGIRSCGRGISRVGVVVVIVVVGLAGFVFLSSRPTRGRMPTRAACLNNLKQLGFAMKMYSSDNGDVFPLWKGTSGDAISPADTAEAATAVGSFGALVTNQYLGNYEVLACPQAETVPATDPLRPPYGADFTRHTLDYAYVAGLAENADSDSPIALDDVVRGDCRRIPGLACGRGSNHGADGVNVLYVGGHVLFEASTAGGEGPVGFLPELDKRLQPSEGESWRVRWD